MSNIVRHSKFRHVYGNAFRKEICYENLKVGVCGQETDLIKANNRFFAVPWVVGGGGCMMVWPLAKVGKLPDAPKLIHGHKGKILDFAVTNYDEYILATGSEDAHVLVWRVPSDDGITVDRLETPELDLVGHKRKVVLVDFHPLASHLLVTQSADGEFKFWDLKSGSASAQLSLPDAHPDEVNNISWNFNGSKFASACKDKKIRIVAPRENHVVVQSGIAHEGNKGFRVLWLGRKYKLITVGFNKMSERQISLWDVNNLDRPIKTITVDSTNGNLIPFYDDSTGVLFVAGKGDTTIKYYEITDDDIIFLNEYNADQPQKGICRLHKVVCDVKKNEFTRFLKLTVKDMVEPIAFHVPRKSEYFQDDIFPDVASYDQAPLTAAEWLAGETREPHLVSLRPAGMTAQSEAPVQEKTGPKYNFQEELKKNVKETASQAKVFQQLYSHLEEASEEFEKKRQQELDNDDDDWD